MKNIDIRRKILGSGLKYWQVADAIGIAYSTFSTRLRKELSSKEKDEIRQTIENLKKKGFYE